MIIADELFWKITIVHTKLELVICKLFERNCFILKWIRINNLENWKADEKRNSHFARFVNRREYEAIIIRVNTVVLVYQYQVCD